MLKFDQWREERLRVEKRYEELRLTSERLYSLRRSSDEKHTHRVDGLTYSLITLRVSVQLLDEYDGRGGRSISPYVTMAVSEHDRGGAEYNPLGILTESELAKVIEIKAMIRRWIAGEGDLLPSDVGDFNLVTE